MDTATRHHARYLNASGERFSGDGEMSGVVCSCGEDGCREFPTVGTGWFQPNAEASSRKLRRRLRVVNRDERHFRARASIEGQEGLSAEYHGTSSSTAGIAYHVACERLLIVEELRRRGMAPVPAPTPAQWWEKLRPNSSTQTLGIIAFLYGSVVSWFLIGLLHVALGVAAGEWGFRGEYVAAWLGLSVLCVMQWLRRD